jgi:hypothetical protein
LNKPTIIANIDRKFLSSLKVGQEFYTRGPFVFSDEPLVWKLVSGSEVDGYTFTVAYMGVRLRNRIIYVSPDGLAAVEE